MPNTFFLVVGGLAAGLAGAALGAGYGGVCRLYAWTRSWGHEPTAGEALANGMRRGAGFLGVVGAALGLLLELRHPALAITAALAVLLALLVFLGAGAALLLAP